MATAKGSATVAATSPAPTKGILKVVPVFPALDKFLGSSEASRTHAVKKVWVYIKLPSDA